MGGAGRALGTVGCRCGNRVCTLHQLGLCPPFVFSMKKQNLTESEVWLSSMQRASFVSVRQICHGSVCPWSHRARHSPAENGCSCYFEGEGNALLGWTRNALGSFGNEGEGAICGTVLAEGLQRFLAGGEASCLNSRLPSLQRGGRGSWNALPWGQNGTRARRGTGGEQGVMLRCQLSSGSEEETTWSSFPDRSARSLFACAGAKG